MAKANCPICKYPVDGCECPQCDLCFNQPCICEHCDICDGNIEEDGVPPKCTQEEDCPLHQ